MFVDTQEDAFLRDLSKPSLEALSYLLRHEELWPKGFGWFYGNCASCAMGLAGKLWGVDDSKSDFWVHDPEWRSIESHFPVSVIKGVFWGQKFFKGKSMEETEVIVLEITPGMIADEIDKYIAKRRT